MKRFRAVVFGAGNIGAKIDVPGDRPAQTHVGAYKNHTGFELVGICDPVISGDLTKWGVPFYTDPEALCRELSFDVATVCVPPAYQPAILEKLANCDVKAVVAEKPLASSVEETEKIVSLYREKGIVLIVNFSRRFLNFYRKLASDLASQNVLCVTLKYAKGLRHNGSHGLDILRLLLGEMTEAQFLFKRIDDCAEDPTCAFFLSYKKCPQVFLQALDQNSFTLFELDITTTTNRYVINNDHRDCHFYEVQDGKGVPLGKRLVHLGTISTGHETALESLVGNLYDVLRSQAVPHCDGENAIYSAKLIDHLHGLFK